MTYIEQIFIRKILDSRGNPTVEVEILTENGYGIAAAPSGASTGEHEVMAIPEAGIDAAIATYEDDVIPQLIGADASQQRLIDDLLHQIDGTPNFARLGGNLTVATSLAAAKATASTLGIPLYQYVAGTFACRIPHPQGNIIGGGRHAIGGTDIQEFLVMSTADSASDSVFGNAMAHKRVGQKLKKLMPDAAIGKGDEGAWVAKLTNEKALEILRETCDEVSGELGFKVVPGLDIAASELFDGKNYKYKDKTLTPDQQIDYMVKLVEDFQLATLEDPLDENDFEGYTKLTEAIGGKVTIIDDDLLVTNKARLEKAIEMKAGNAILIKPNQIGTLTETYETAELARTNGWKTVISHRSGETTDETIAHLGVAFGSYAIKTGAVGGGRIAKLNELIRIEEDLEG